MGFQVLGVLVLGSGRGWGQVAPTLRQARVADAGPQLLHALAQHAALERRALIDIACGQALALALCWHCWSLTSQVLSRVSLALHAGVRQALV